MVLFCSAKIKLKVNFRKNARERKKWTKRICVWEKPSEFLSLSDSEFNWILFGCASSWITTDYAFKKSENL